MSWDDDSDDVQVSTNSSEPPAWLQPYSEEYLQRAGSLSNQQQEFIPGGSERIAGFDPAQTLGIDMGTQRAVVGSPLNEAAQQGLLSVMGSDDPRGPAFSSLTNNLVDQSNRGLADQFNMNVAPQTSAMFNKANTFGSTGQQEPEASQRFSLGRAMLENENTIRDRALSRSLTGASMAPTAANQDYVDADALMRFGGANQGLNQAILDADYARFLDIRNEPTRRLDILGGGLNTAGGGYSRTTTTTPGTNNTAANLGGLAGLLGGVGTLYGAFN